MRTYPWVLAVRPCADRGGCPAVVLRPHRWQTFFLSWDHNHAAGGAQDLQPGTPGPLPSPLPSLTLQELFLIALPGGYRLSFIG